MRLIAAILALALAPAVVPGAQAQNYPSRPITVVVPFPAGGPADTMARVLTERMRTSLGQPMIVENVGGAGGSIGAARVARAAPDGYTLCVGNWTSHVGTPAILPVQYDALNDFQPISLLPIAPLSIAASTKVPANNVAELVAWLKANPNKASAGTVGAGSPSNIITIHFQKETGTSIQLVPYRGGGPATQDLISGQIDLRMGGEASVTLPYWRSRNIKILAMLSKTRWSAAPEIPTVDEAGLPGLHMSLWFALWAPRGTPNEVVAKLSAATAEAFADPAVRERFEKLGQDVPARELQSPEGLAAHHKAEIDKWWPIIKAAGIKVK